MPLGVGALVLAAVLSTVLLQRLDRATVEAQYSVVIFPVIGQGIGAVTGLVPFSITEVGAAGLIVGAALVLLTRWRRLTTWAALIGTLAVGWLLFAPLWGLNYRRAPMAELFGFDVHPTPVAELHTLAEELIAAAGAAWVPTMAEGSNAHAAFVEGPSIYTHAGERYPFLAGTYAHPKALISSRLFSWFGLLGFYSPYTAEANLNVDAPNVILPFVVLHEMAHQRGVAPEDEANFVAWLLCRDQGSALFRYSGAWEGMRNAVFALWAVDEPSARALWATLDPRVRADSDAYDAWHDAHRSPLETFGQKVNDTYLRTQGVPDGIESYGRVVDLLLAERRARVGS